jgi:hypothetical protein
MDKWRPEPIPHLTMLDIKRFEIKVDRRPGLGPNGDCHEWISAKDAKGYGVFELGGRTCRANRVAYYMFTGHEPYPLIVKHSCDWPPCVRGGHLSSGTQKQNMEEAVARNRMPRGARNGSLLHPESLKRGNDSPVSKIDDEEALLIINLAAAKIPNSHIAELFDMNGSTIGDIVNGITRKHLPITRSAGR